MDILCKVTDRGLVPMFDSDAEAKCRLREGSVVRVSVTKQRNYNFHKKFFALVRLTYENLPERLHRMLNIRSEEDLLVLLKLDLGLARIVYYGTRRVVIPGSISFASMDQYEFERFYSRALDIITEIYLRGTTRQEIIDNLENFK